MQIIPEYILIFGSKTDELMECGWILHNEMVHDLHYTEYFAGDKEMKLEVKCI